MLVFSIILGYLGLVVLVSVLCIVLSLTNVRLGIRVTYLSVLTAIFNWVARKSVLVAERSDSALREEDSDSDSGHVPAQGPTPTKHLSTKYLLQKQLSKQDSIAELVVEDSVDDPLLAYLSADLIDWCNWGMTALVTDEFTESLRTAELPSWNLMTRTDRGYAFISARMLILWIIGTFVRYWVLLPIRLLIAGFALAFIVVGSTLLGVLGSEQGDTFEQWISLTFFRLLARSVSLSVTYHSPENRAVPGGICVANHTSLVDVLTLASDNGYALVGQKHGGVLGKIEAALGNISDHIWLERGDKKSRQNTVELLKKHIETEKLPILLFPEGVCVNNTRVMRFRKGSFELGAVIYPVAIKYDRAFGDPFWVEATWMQHQINLMTCWGIRADVYYLPPMTQREGEDALQFSFRVKDAIARQGGFVAINWDGYLQYKATIVDPKTEALKKSFGTRLRNLSGSKLNQYGTEV